MVINSFHFKIETLCIMRKQLFNVSNKISNHYIIFIVFNLVSHFPFLDRNLWEMNDFRQAQTAWAIRSFRENGVSLNTPLPIFGQNSTLPMEFPIYQIICAALSSLLRIDIIPAARLVSLISFIITGILLARLVELLVGSRNLNTLFLAVFSLTPFGFQWSHSVSIEFLATAYGSFSLLYCAKSSASEKKIMREGFLFALACIGMSLTFLTKITTGAVFAAIFFLLTIVRSDFSFRQLRKLTWLLPIFIGYLSGFFWNSYANELKKTQYFGSYLTSDKMESWNFGSLNQRLEVGTYYKIIVLQWSSIVGSFLSLTILLFFLTMKRKCLNSRHQRYLRIVWLLWISVMFPILIFTNLYFIHDYYSVAIYGFLVLILVLLVSIFFDYLTSNQSFVKNTLLPIILCLGLVSTTYGDRYFFNNYYYLTGVNSNGPAWLTDVKDRVGSSSVIFVNCNWNPVYPYYIGGQAYMLPPLINKPPASYINDAEFLIDCKTDSNPYLYDWNEYVVSNKGKLIKLSSHLYALLDK